MTRLLALNLAAPTPDRARALLEYLWLREDEVLVLGEITTGAGSRLMLDVCRAAGYAVCLAPISGRGRGVAVVVRGGLEVDAERHPAGARLVDVTVDGLRILGVYGVASDPVRYSGSAQRERKRAWLREFRAVVAAVAARPGPVVLAGDLNIVDPDDDLPYVLAEERECHARLLELGFVDAYREAGPGPRVTWVDRSGVGCRYDHAFARDLRVVAAGVDDTPRESGNTDHSALWVEVEGT